MDRLDASVMPEVLPGGPGLVAHASAARSLKHRLLRLLGVGLALATLGLLATLVARDWDAVRSTRWVLSPGWLLASIAGQALVLIGGMALWGLITRRTNAPPVDWTVLWRVWGLASFARYVPGGVWQFVATDSLASRAGVTRDTWSQTLAVHLGISVVSGTVVGLGFAPRFSAWLALPLVLLVHPAVVRRALQWLARVIRQPPLTWHADVPQSAGLLGLSAFGWIASGFTWHLLLRGLGVAEAVPMTLAIGVQAIAFVVSLVVVIAPAGLGVREAVLTFSLAGVVGPGRAVLLAAATRLWVVSAEVLSVALAWSRRR